MNIAISSIQKHSKWLTMLCSLLAGILFAAAVHGQETSSPSESTHSLNTVELSEVFEQQPDAIAGQTVCTRNNCGSFKTVTVSPGDEIWLISGRSSHLNPCDLSALQVCKLQNSQWNEACIEDLIDQHSSDSSRVTMVYVHGNRTDLSWAKSRGLQFYENAFQKGCMPRPPIRFVIFAWKSEMEVLRLYPDFRIKSERSVRVGTTFGEFLSLFPDRKMVIGGFSLGAQTVMSGLSNPKLHNQDEELGKYKVAIIAPSLNPEFVRCGLPEYPNNSIAEMTEVFLNRSDRAVKASQKIVRRRSKASITTLEQLAWHSAAAPSPIRIIDCTSELPRKHSIVRYGLSTTLQNGLATMLNSFYAPDSSVQIETEPFDSVVEEVAPPVK